MRGLYFYSMDIWQTLLLQDIQQFIVDNEQVDAHSISLQHKTLHNIPPQLLASQILGRQKVKIKIPSYYRGKNILYPPSLNLEQSSSQATAIFKSKIVTSSVGSKASLIDLTGGFGVDSFFLSQVANTVTHVEPNTELQKIAVNNHNQLGATNIQYENKTAEALLEDFQKNIDVFYIDPARRKAGQKVFAFADCEPNLETLQHKLFSISKHVLAKAAPLLDISMALKQLCFVKNVFVVAVENECKEVLFWCERGFTDEPEIKAVSLTTLGEELFSFSFTQKREHSSQVQFGEPQQYLYEPNAALLKAGAFKTVSNAFNLFKLAPSTHLYTSHSLHTSFPGRIFKLETLVKADTKSVHALLPEAKANVLTRNYPLKPEELKKKLKLKDGGEKYLIGFSGQHAKHLALCSRIL